MGQESWEPGLEDALQVPPLSVLPTSPLHPGTKEDGLRVQGAPLGSCPCSSHHILGRREVRCRVGDLGKTGKLWELGLAFSRAEVDFLSLTAFKCSSESEGL